MKRIGIIYDKDSKKVFLLPNEVKALVDKGIVVNVLGGVGVSIGLSDNAYLTSGAKVLNDWKEIINSSDVILKTNAFSQPELKLIGKKTAITFVNYLVNVDMLYYMLQNNTTGLEWQSLLSQSNYVFFSKLEEKKAPVIMKLVQNALATGLAKKTKDRVTYPKNPKMLILNASFAGVALAKLALAAGYRVTIADNDTKYLIDLKNTADLKDLDFVDASYETLVEQFKKANVFVNTTIAPNEVTKLRITKDMAQSMPKGSLLIDAACEHGYAFHFVKKYADREIKWNKIEKSFYMAYEDFTNYFAKETSEIISSKSLPYLLSVIEKGVNDSAIWRITNCQDGKVLNSTINAKLRLY